VSLRRPTHGNSRIHFPDDPPPLSHQQCRKDRQRLPLQLLPNHGLDADGDRGGLVIANASFRCEQNAKTCKIIFRNASRLRPLLNLRTMMSKNF
jgi:hypothetical protein